jgi:hypothetical protein
LDWMIGRLIKQSEHYLSMNFKRRPHKNINTSNLLMKQFFLVQDIERNDKRQIIFFKLYIVLC